MDLWQCKRSRLHYSQTQMKLYPPERSQSGNEHTHTHLTWPSVHAVSTSFGPNKSLHHCRGAYWTSSHVPAECSGQLRLVCLETDPCKTKTIKASASSFADVSSALDVVEFPLVKISHTDSLPVNISPVKAFILLATTPDNKDIYYFHLMFGGVSIFCDGIVIPAMGRENSRKGKINIK